MGVFSRFKDIVGANINAMLDKAEDPAKMIRLMMQEMEDTLVELKSSCADRLASLSVLEREREELEELVQRWDKRARVAVVSSREDLAKEALIEKSRATKSLGELDKERNSLNGIVDECKHNIEQLEEKLDQVSRRHRVLMQRSVHANEKRRVNESIHNASGLGAMHRFGELEDRIDRMEADASLAGSDERRNREMEFQKMEATAEIEGELQKLKKEIGAKSGTTPVSSK